ncbi:MmcQ/YjbR family DNA-binding protein [Dactylosporangium fulvum]
MDSGGQRPAPSAVTLVRMADLVSRVRAICTAFPGVTEKLSHGTPLWSARKGFVQIWPDGHHDNTFPHLWCAAPPGVQESLIGRDSRRYFRPPYVGHRGWVGMRLDGDLDWDDVEELCELAYRTVTPAARG